MPYPVRPQIPNPYQIIGQAAQQVGGDVRTYGKEQDELAERFNLMMQKRADAELQKKQQEDEFKLKKNADDRSAAEADAKAKAEAAKSKFLQDFTGANPADPANQLKLKSALTAGIIDASTYKALQPKERNLQNVTGKGLYEIPETGAPQLLVDAPAPKPDRGQVVTDANGNLVIVDPVTGMSKPVVNPSGNPLQAKGSSSIADLEAKANNSLSVLDQMVGSGTPGSPDYKPPHPGFTSVVGFGKGPGMLFGAKSDPVPGTDAANFKALLDQVNGVAFLQAFNDLKGGGQITEVEGQKATNAISRLRSSLSEDAFIEAANELKGIIRNGLQRAKTNRSGGQPNTGVAPQNPNAESLRGKYNY